MRALACLLVLLAACGDASPTAIRLHLDASQAHKPIDGLEIDVNGHELSLEPLTEVLVLVPDDSAGNPLELVVRGSLHDIDIVSATVSPVPVRGGTVDVNVTLTPIACANDCQPGDTACLENGVATCMLRDEDACPIWGQPVQCGGDTPQCNLGACVSGCHDECALGETICDGTGGVRTCVQDADEDDCNEFGGAVACTAGDVCSNGVCSARCQDECQDGQTRCFGDATSTCLAAVGGGCRRWSAPSPCNQNTTCSGGVCGSGCTDDCTTDECSSLFTYSSCGDYDSDACKDLSPGSSCQPSDACQVGSCAAGGCGTPTTVSCTTPPPAECMNGNTVKRIYSQNGVCTDGGCEYGFTDVPCDGCPTCAVDPCDGVTCNTPPASSCFVASGTCSGGVCNYDFDDSDTCNDGDGCTLNDRCGSGNCVGDPKPCNTPPAQMCVSGNKLRKYNATGTCTGGTCEYGFTDSNCVLGCNASTNACNLF